MSNSRANGVFATFLDGGRIYTCAMCNTHLARHDEIISKAFNGRHGRAYLFNHVENISLGPREDRVLMSGLHSVADISCLVCQTVVGWKYIAAFEPSQRYKEGKYIVEKAKITKENGWDD
ncbi:uncharacterized protein VTP21DRAFT_6335 [Calcarisporiella thermophila]|uniref:uncharacterized protein n=1 Tax=Calcarisporiella thermophila TaxID=911321 RepID=UPI0037423486